MDLILQKLPNGTLAPIDDEQREMVDKLKPGAWVRCKVTRIRNAGFFKKWWHLARYAYDIWSDTMPTMEWRGQRVQPDIERFRQDLTILAGHYKPVFNARGEVRVEAASLQWSKMDEATFEKFYSATINAILQKVLSRDDLTPEKLRAYVDTVMKYD